MASVSMDTSQFLNFCWAGGLSGCWAFGAEGFVGNFGDPAASKARRAPAVGACGKTGLAAVGLSACLVWPELLTSSHGLTWFGAQTSVERQTTFPLGKGLCALPC